MTQKDLDMTLKPRFEITSLRIRDLRSLKSLSLPKNGMGWEDRFPPLAVIAGANGSGKTTLLRCITQAARLFTAGSATIPSEIDATELQIDFAVSNGNTEARKVRFLVGDEDYIEHNKTKDCIGYIRTSKRPRSILRGEAKKLRGILRNLVHFAESSWPRVVFMPSDDRDLIVPGVKYKAPGRLQDDLGFVAAWERLGPKQWAGSTLELLFSARWADLNAKEEGHTKDATNFDAYARAFADLTGERKKLAWTRKGELVVQLKDKTTHELGALSSGERQALFLLAELRRRWRPGSLVLIDELELHLHDAWQGKLLDILAAMQKELGGQVIVTTQSHSLFEMAPLGTRALLGREHLR